MRIAYTSVFDSQNVRFWSGTPYHMSQAFAAAGSKVEYIGPLKRELPRFFKVKQVWNKYVSGQRESPRFNVHAAKHYSSQVAKALLRLSVDVVVSPLINPIAYLDCKQPIVLWTDSLYASLVGFYPPFAAHSQTSVIEGNIITTECLKRCKLALFSSEWAANSALEIYGAERDKVAVVPFGANIDSYPRFEEIKQIVKSRPRDKIRLLFFAKSWERKGGDITVAVAKALYEAGYPIELTIIGYDSIPYQKTIPPYVKCLGFISKHTPEGKNRIREILANTHFLFVPSRAEAYGIVFCEASAFAVPSLTTYVGGIGTVVKDGVNGMTFPLHAAIEKYCDYITNVMQDHKRYDALALSSYNEFVTRLNWPVAIEKVKELIGQL